MGRNKPKEYVMLVLTRKPDEQIRIGDDIVITIVRVKGNTIRVGVEAPKGVRVIRGELEGKPKDSAVTESTDAALVDPLRDSSEMHSNKPRRTNMATHRPERQANANRLPSAEPASKGQRIGENDRSVQNSSPLGSFVLAARIPMPSPVTTLNSRVG